MARQLQQFRSREHGGRWSRSSPDAVGVDEARIEDLCSPLQKGRPVGLEVRSIVKAAELVLEAGGFGLVVVDFGETPRALTYASSLRIARAAERSGAAVIAIAPWRMCGTFAALSIAASRAETSFSRLAPGSPVMFDGLAVDAMIARNKMGGTGRHVRVRALVDPIPNPFEVHPHSDGKEFPVRISASS